MESFAELFAESQSQVNLTPGGVLKATVVAIRDDVVILNAGLKSEGVVPIEQFKNDQGELEVAVGDSVDVVLESLEDGMGETRLSREKAKRAASWIVLEKAFEQGETLTGLITDKVKGGFTVNVNEIRAFLPGSLVDVRPVRDSNLIEGKPLEFKVIKLDKRRNNVVVSRRAVVEQESNVERQSLLDTMQEGMTYKGVVKNLTDYGAFVDLGGVDGLLHITDMAWKRVKHPNEVVQVGDEVEVKILKFDRDRTRVSLGLKQMGEDPWQDIARRYPNGSRLSGKVTNLTDYGCFVEIEEGVEGLVHVSEMDWTNKNVHPSKVVQVGDECEVMILDIDGERRRISLGIKQCHVNPWEEFNNTHNKGDRVKGKIKSITDFGIFIGLDGNIDGLVHMTDISWNLTPEDAVRQYKKGDEIEAVILAIDPERERISLSIKQLDLDPFGQFVESNPKGSMVKGTVLTIDAKGGVTVSLGDSVEGYIRGAELARETPMKEGDAIEAKFIGVDRKKRIISLSTKAVDEEDSRATLGDLIREQMDNRE